MESFQAQLKDTQTTQERKSQMAEELLDGVDLVMTELSCMPYGRFS